MRDELSWTLHRDDLDIVVIVGYTYSPGSKATRDDPGYGPEVEITDVNDALTGAKVVLTGPEEKEIIEHISDNQDDWDECDRADRAYDERRDRDA